MTDLIDPSDAWHEGRRVSDIVGDEQPDFAYADLRNVDLSGFGFDEDRERLAYASFWEADLRGVDLSGCDLQESNFWKADLRRADISLSFLWGADLRHAKLEDCRMVETGFYTADVRHTILEDQ